MVVVALSGYDDKRLITDYLTARAAGVVAKTVGAVELLRCVKEAAAGRPALDPLATARVLEALANPAPSGGGELSPRERQLLTLVAGGCTNEEIAAQLFISAQTVKTHLGRIFTELGVRDRASAAVKATREHLLD